MTDHCWSLDVHRGRCLFSKQFPRLLSTAEAEERAPVELSASWKGMEKLQEAESLPPKYSNCRDQTSLQQTIATSLREWQWSLQCPGSCICG